mmetsp:Transcript_14250/g.29548  ORF Transcript_14250/g.29548 Transcript_14250/m.29548 type:complete len:205 (+) Transcript_14250:848-1462(+)
MGQVYFPGRFKRETPEKSRSGAAGRTPSSAAAIPPWAAASAEDWRVPSRFSNSISFNPAPIPWPASMYPMVPGVLRMQVVIPPEPSQPTVPSGQVGFDPVNSSDQCSGQASNKYLVVESVELLPRTRRATVMVISSSSPTSPRAELNSTISGWFHSVMSRLKIRANKQGVKLRRSTCLTEWKMETAPNKTGRWTRPTPAPSKLS